MAKSFLPLLVLAFGLFSFPIYSQECAPPKIVANSNSNNLFSPEQEMFLGDVILESMSGEVRLFDDPQLLVYVNNIGEKLIKHLPPTGLKYKFHLMDISDANAFNTPGGHIFLSRKLVAFSANEDELAGVIAHELGHAVVRHGAQDMSESFRKILNVSTLGDGKDVRQKFNLLIENIRTKRISRQSGGHENEQQLEADRIGLFAMVAAGYDPAAFTSFFDRLTESEGKTGSWFSDLFGKTRPSQKRLRDMIRTTEQLPQSCRDGRIAQANEDFLNWQAAVVSFRNKGREEKLPGLMWKKEMTTKLRTDASQIDFSADGKYLLVKDDFAITVFEREPLKSIFQIPAENTKDIYFTPDGNSVVFTDENLRFERWNIAQKKATEVRELVLRRDCWEHKLSPDGNYLACIDTAATVNLIDTKTGKKIFEKKKFYELTSMEFLMMILLRDSDDETGFYRIAYSPDSKYLVLSRSDKFRFILRIDGMNYGSENTTLALDLTTLKPVNLGGDIKKLTSRAFAFLDSNRIVGTPAKKIEESGVFSFPEGKRLQKFNFYAESIKRSGNTDHLIVKPLANAAVGVFDVKTGLFINGMNKKDISIWNDVVAAEAASGSIMLRKLNFDQTKNTSTTEEIIRADIPVSAIGTPFTANVSENFKWMMFSAKSRGGLWNIETGERKLHTRGFRGSAIDETGVGVGDFPKDAATPQTIALLKPASSEIIPVREFTDGNARLYGRFILLRTSLKPKSDEDSENLRRAVKFEIKDLLKDQVIWKRDFPEDAPRYSFDEYSGRMIFYWRADTDAGKAELKKSPELQSKVSGSKEGDFLVEVIDAYTQKSLGKVFLETGKGSFYIRTGSSDANWLMIYDSEGRVLVYSISDGTLKHRFFGKNAVLNPSKNVIAVENFPGEINLYNLDTGDSDAKITFGGKAAFIRFNLNGDKMFVLSDNQIAYAFDLQKMNLPTSERQK